MKNCFVVAGTILGIAVLASATVLVAQEPPALVLMADQHVKPGMTAEWEEARRQYVAFLTEHDAPFQEFLWISDQGVRRQGTFLDGWDAMDRRRQWALDSGLFTQGFWRTLVETMNYTDNLIVRPRLSLNYGPDDPRVSIENTGFIRERRYYLRPGMNGAATDVREAMLELHQRHNIRDGYFVGSQIAGPQSPRMFVFMPRQDVSDWFTTAAANTEVMGDEVRELRAQMNSLAHKAEWIHWTPRPDLGYQPAGQ